MRGTKEEEVKWFFGGRGRSMKKFIVDLEWANHDLDWKGVVNFFVGFVNILNWWSLKKIS